MRFLSHYFSSSHCRFIPVLISFVFRCACVIPLLLSSCAHMPEIVAKRNLALNEDVNSVSEQQALVRELADLQLSASTSKTTIPQANGNSEESGGAIKSEEVMNTFSAQLINVPVEHVLHSIANDAQLDLQFNQPLDGSVTLLTNDQTVEQMLVALARQVAIYWKIDGGVLHLWGDQPYTESYAVDYLNIDRSTRSRVGLATQVGTINASIDGGSSGVSNSSQTLLENSADHHFWASLSSDMEGLVSRGGQSETATYTINRDAGLVTLHGNGASHQVLKDYLLKLNRSAQRQVLIEATVVEVALSNDFEAGIDWQLVANKSNGVSAAQVLSGAPQVTAESINRITAPNGLLSFVQKTDVGTIAGTLNMLEQFGDVRILSKPRIIALNNQSSVLKVVDNKVYFTVAVERTRSENKDEVITETEIHTVPVGLVMNVTPYIDKDDSVMLNVRPTLSRILGFVDDPNPELAAANVKNSVPEIQVREMESMLRVNSGDVAIIGGLMQEIQDGSDRTMPGLSEIPLLGALFRQRRKVSRQSELLIVLKPTVLAS